MRRRNAYRWGGLTLLLSIGVFVAWIRWLRPAEGQWEGVPPRLSRILAATRDRPAPAAVPRAPAPGGARPAPGPPGIDLSALLARRPAERPRGRARPRIDAILRVRGRAPRLNPAGPPGHPGPLSLSPGRRAAPGLRGERRSRPRRLPAWRPSTGSSGSRRPASTSSGCAKARPATSPAPSRCAPNSGAALSMADGCDTDPTGTFTVERVACIGSCSLAPVITIDDQIYGHLTALSVSGVLRQFIDWTVETGVNGHRRSHTAQAALHPHLSHRRGASGRDSHRRRHVRPRQPARTPFTPRCTKRWPPSAAAPRSRRSAAAGSATTNRWSRSSPAAAGCSTATSSRDDVRSAREDATCGRAGLLRNVREEAHDVRAGSSTIAPGSRSRRAPSTRRPTSASRCASSSRTAARSIRSRWTNTATADGMRALEECLTTPDA